MGEEGEVMGGCSLRPVWSKRNIDLVRYIFHLRRACSPHVRDGRVRSGPKTTCFTGSTAVSWSKQLWLKLECVSSSNMRFIGAKG